MAVADIADMDDLSGPGFHHRLDPLEHGRLRPHHGVELALEGFLGRAAERRIGTAELNRWLGDVRSRRPPANKGVKAIKAFYMVQYETSPPRFKIMVNSRALVSKPFAYYLENQLREEYQLWGIPVIIDFEGKEERYK